MMISETHPRLDQIGAKRIEEQEADPEHQKAAQIEDDNAPTRTAPSEIAKRRARATAADD